MKRVMSLIPAGTTVVVARERLGWTQEHLAEKSGVSKRSVEKLEAGKPMRRDTLEKVAVALGVDVKVIVRPRERPVIQTDFFSRKCDDSISTYKEAVARRVAKLIDLGTSIACSSGTTTALAVSELVRTGKHPQVLTNNLGIIDLAGESVSVTLAGGTYFRPIHATVGNDAERLFDNAKCRVALVGASACTPELDVYLLHHEDVHVYDRILACATQNIIFALDVFKLARSDTWKWTNLDEIVTRCNPRCEIVVVTNSPATLSDSEQKCTVIRTLEALKRHDRVQVDFAKE